MSEGRRVFVARIMEITPKKGGDPFYKIEANNPNQTNKDGEPNPYYKGALIYFDAATGKYYKIKSMAIRQPSPHGEEYGEVNSVMINLDDKYHVEEME